MTLFNGQCARFQIDGLSLKLMAVVKHEGGSCVRLAADWAEKGLKVDRVLHIPTGRTALFCGGRQVREGRNEFGPPVLSKVPYVNRLFKNVGYGRETEHVVLMVTPRVIMAAEEEAAPAPKPIVPALKPAIAVKKAKAAVAEEPAETAVEEKGVKKA